VDRRPNPGDGRLRAWFKRNVPQREELARNRWLKPIAGRVLRSELWRFTRRSVPRGVALGLLVGIFLLIPGLQIAAAVFFALPIRANVPISAAMTWLSNPATTPFILIASVYVGGEVLGLDANLSGLRHLMERRAPIGDWVSWMLSDAAPALIVGLAVVSIVVAAIGWVIAVLGWRWWIAHKWRSRGHRIRHLNLDHDG
jgi:uncharacterized protein (DUF2062 family)